jgi:hypothetical protein
MSREPAVTAIARPRGTRRGAAGTALLVHLRAATPVPRPGGTAGAQRLRALTGRLPRPRACTR